VPSPELVHARKIAFVPESSLNVLASAPEERSAPRFGPGKT
jgi:hypothetical protein